MSRCDSDDGPLGRAHPALSFGPIKAVSYAHPAHPEGPSLHQNITGRVGAKSMFPHLPLVVEPGS